MGNSTRIFVAETIQNFEILDFIAVGGESIVFKGRKQDTNRTYALKFRNKESFDDFKIYELSILSRLYECNIGKIAGVICDIPQQTFKEVFKRIPSAELNGRQDISPNNSYFCIIEDYIPGCNLSSYCKCKMLTPTQNTSYKEVLEFQRKLLGWTIQFCEIMSNITGKHRVLHLDIKPENIMIMNETESVVLIDFGKALQFKDNCMYADLCDNVYEENLYESASAYGTPSFAAPECCYSPDMLKINNQMNVGRVDERSDIFSFGATLWDCVNTQNGVLEIKESEDGYFRRDLFNTPMGYTEEFENIIIKCTEKNPDKRFQSFEELKKAAKNALKKTPRADSKSKISRGFAIVAAVLVFMGVGLFALTLRSNSLTFEIAQHEFVNSELTEYTVKSFAEVAKEYAKANKTYNNNSSDVYKAILDKVSADDVISTDEYNYVLIPCLKYTNDKTICDSYANGAMANVQADAVKTIAESVSREESFKTGTKCDGLRIAEKINDVYNNRNYSDAYDIVEEFSANLEYKTAILKLVRLLKNDVTNLMNERKLDNGSYKNALNDNDEDKMEEIESQIRKDLEKRLEDIETQLSKEV